MKVGILGGGLSGIALQRFLRHESVVVEKEERPGGLCRTIEKNGFKYDIGGHILFSKDQAIMEVVKAILGDNINYCKRANTILYKGRYVKYPFENGLGALDKADIYDCLIGYLKNDHPKPGNLEEWIYYTFGDGIARQYLAPYNEKIWKEPLKNISLDWVERVPKPPLEDIVKSCLGIETEGYLHQLFFLYPKKGGAESLIKMARKADGQVVTNFEIKTIRKKGKSWVVANGCEEHTFDKLVITFPMTEAIACFEDVPPAVKRAASLLRSNIIRTIMVGVNNESLMDKSAIYIPQSDTIFHRVCFMGFFSKNNVPTSCSSLIAEVTTHPGLESESMSDDALIKLVVDQVSALGIIDRKDIVETDAFTAKYGYVIHDLNRAESMKTLRLYFDSLGIDLHGRFAEFEYINMDEVLRRSVTLAERMNRRSQP